MSLADERAGLGHDPDQQLPSCCTRSPWRPGLRRSYVMSGSSEWVSLGCAVHTTLPAGVGYTSLGLEAKYVRPITRDTGRVLCEANVLYRGRRQATAEASLTAAGSGKLLAHAVATSMILGGS